MTRLLHLHLDSRRTRLAVALLIATALALRACAKWTHGTSTLSQLLPILIACAAAAVIAAGTRSLFGDPERASRPLPTLRLLHVLTLLAIATGALAAASDDPATMVRNLAGLTGLALLTATFTGAPLAWTAPLGYVLICAAEIDLHQDPPWAWPILPADNRAATLLAATTLIAGLTITTLRGPRDTPSERP
ncbi:hypothetical protein [Amycolatopsis sp. CA-126428]|uniref:hypothetical protein n=1 Tax=Amycolatopsis sp. CA-126428 TaxID=2073158 RepID=UPI000CD2C25C|nr:hypothetical protein [Amycolatopsis sp. CA-126428]